MLRKKFNEKWLYSRRLSTIESMTNLGEATSKPIEVTLPHDAMIMEQRRPDTKNQTHTGFFPGGTYEYKRNFYAPEEYSDKVVTFEFEGVYMNAMVYINGEFAGKRPYGYSNFYINANRFLKIGAENEIKVIANTSAEPNSRWYTGSGIYRDVKIIIGDLLHIQVDGVKISTPNIREDLSIVEVCTSVENDGNVTKNVYVLTEVKDGSGNIVASDKLPLTAYAGEAVTVRQRLDVHSPKLWSVDTPYLYSCSSKIVVNNEVLDEEENQFGIRKLQLDRKHGLRINGEVVKLRGACIHHDNGVLGAATFERAEERRIELMKEAGFNAVRSSHQPISKAMLDACDRIGMFVMDEAFDAWSNSKVDHDYHLNFHEWWEKDIQAMVDKDYNHPSVIIYSIGNEIQEAGTKEGANWNRKIAEKTRSLDGTRFIINAVNGMICITDQLGEIMAELNDNTISSTVAEEETKEINNLMSSLMGMMNQIVTHEKVGKLTEETFAGVDIAGYNYMSGRYELDASLYPNRIICGTETFPQDIDTNWKMVKRNTHLIGDFTWTGWDYLGEAGIGKLDYTLDDSKGIYGPYPWYIAYCGDIDITGNRRPQSYYREIVWELRKEPYITVQRPEHYHDKISKTSWSWSDSISSWTWPGYENKPVKIEVYSDAEEVELLINNQSIGRAPVGDDNRFKALFDTIYQPGELTAVAYVNGQETGRMKLQSAGEELELAVKVDRESLQATGSDLAYINISLRDGMGTLQTAVDRKVSIAVEGEGILQGFGSADPTSLENFFDTERTTFDGKVLAVIRSKAKAGAITVTVSADGCKPYCFVVPVI
ncbi:beta-galactosidase [Paenibacillus intestini]|nr:beta-galactosidase [Paenibacillus intestini]